MLLNLSRHLPDSIYYVFPLFSEFAELKAITPHFLDHCCLIRIEDLMNQSRFAVIDLARQQLRYDLKKIATNDLVLLSGFEKSVIMLKFLQIDDWAFWLTLNSRSIGK